MHGMRLSRREVLRWLAGASAAAVLGGTGRGPDLAAAADPPGAESFIDAHVHLANLRITGVPELTTPGTKTKLAPFDPTTAAQGARQLADAIQAEMKAAGVGQALCMPRAE